MPVPPLEIVKVPDDILEAIKFVCGSPEPEKFNADTLVADIVVPVKGPDKMPPVKVKNNDNVEQ